MENNIKVSVIIPIYNAEAFLHECLDSVINQTLREIEIICVNDGSTDNSLEILNEYAANDERIKIINQQNKGGGAARNAGLKIAKGEYLAFLDSDDSFDIKALKMAFDKAIDEASDIVVFKGKIFNNITNQYKDIHWILKDKFLPSNIPFSYVDIPDYIFQVFGSVVWNKLYSKKMIENCNIKFLELKRNNDNYFAYISLVRAKTISILNEKLIFYRKINKNSCQETLHEYPLDFYDSLMELRNELNRIGVYKLVERSYINKLIEVSLYYLDNAKNEETFILLYNIIKNKILPEFDILKYSKEYFFNEEKFYDIFNNVRKINEQSAAEYVLNQNKFSLNNNKLKVSVIVPVYNKEDYIEYCINSILKQTLKEIEILIVDDGSKDNSLNILKYFAEKDNRIIIIEQKNKGGGIARNNALKIARGEYIGFVDADDWIETNYFECLYSNAKEKDADIARTFQYRHHSDKIYEPGLNLIIKEKYENNELLNKDDHFHNVTNAIYKNDLIKENNVFFDKTRSSHDKLFTLKATFYAKKMIPVVGTAYHKRNDVPGQLITMNSSRIKNSMLADKKLVEFVNKASYNTPEEYINSYIKLFYEAHSYLKTAMKDPNISMRERKRFFSGMVYKYKQCKYKDLLIKNHYKNYFPFLKENNFYKYFTFYKGEIPEKMAIRTFFGRVKRKIIRIILGRHLFNNLENMNMLYENVENIKSLNERILKEIQNNNDAVKNNLKNIKEDIKERITKTNNNISELKSNINNVKDNLKNIKEDIKEKYIKTKERITKTNNNILELKSNINNIKGNLKKHNEKINLLDRRSWQRAQKYAPEEKYAEILSDWYHEKTGKVLDLKNPQTYNEKIQWLKLYDATPLKTRLTDKYLVRDWIKEKIGEEYLIPLLGVYNNFEEIDFDALPNQFVLKANHGSNMNIIVKDKTQLDLNNAKEDINKWLGINYAYNFGLQLHYRDIEPKIIAEKYMEDESGELKDYKFICFNGELKYVWVDTDRYTEHKRNIYNLNWEKMPFSLNYPNTDDIQPPEKLEEMVKLAEILCKDFYHVRVDFYSVNNKIYFGEMTFTSGSGQEKFDPPEYDRIWGDMIKLPKKRNNVG